MASRAPITYNGFSPVAPEGDTIVAGNSSVSTLPTAFHAAPHLFN